MQIPLGQPVPENEETRGFFLKLETWSTDALYQLFMSILAELEVVRDHCTFAMPEYCDSVCNMLHALVGLSTLPPRYLPCMLRMKVGSSQMHVSMTCAILNSHAL